MAQNNVYKGVAAWMQAILQHSQSNTLGDWWNARTLECVNLGTELSVANELAVYKDGLDFTKALHAAAKQGSLTQSDVDYNVNKLLMVRWKFSLDFFHLEEITPLEEISPEELTNSDEEAIITFTASIDEAPLTEEAPVEEVVQEAPTEQQVVAEKPKGGRPKRVNK